MPFISASDFLSSNTEGIKTPTQDLTGVAWQRFLRIARSRSSSIVSRAAFTTYPRVCVAKNSPKISPKCPIIAQTWGRWWLWIAGTVADWVAMTAAGRRQLVAHDLRQKLRPYVDNLFTTYKQLLIIFAPAPAAVFVPLTVAATLAPDRATSRAATVAITCRHKLPP